MHMSRYCESAVDTMLVDEAVMSLVPIIHDAISCSYKTF